MSKIIAFVNQKGGVAKTTSCINIGAGLSLLGKNVLLVDMDAQASLSISAGYRIKENDLSVYEVLQGKANINNTIQKKGDSYSILPTDIRLSGADIAFSNTPGREYLLKEALESLNNNYDYILIDCPQNLNLTTLNALTACNSIVIPVQAQYLALNGIAQLMDTIAQVKKRMNPQLDILGVLLTMYDNRRTSDREVLENVKEAFKDKVFHTLISNNVALAEAPSYGKDIFEYKPDSKGAEMYKQLVNEILEKEN